MSADLPAVVAERSRPKITFMHWIALAAILLGAIALRIYFFQGYMNSDDAGYIALAKDSLQGRLLVGGTPAWEGCHFKGRSGMIYSLAASIKLCGMKEWALVLFPFICSIAHVAVTFLFALRFATPSAALIAAALMAIMPIDVRYATHILPDGPMGFFVSCSLLLLVLALERRTTWALALLAFSSGLTLGLAWLTKEMAIYLFMTNVLVLALAYGISRKNVIVAACMAAAFVLIVAVEMIVYAIHRNDPLYKYHLLETTFARLPQYFFREGSPYGYQKGHYWEALFQRWFVTGPKGLLLNRELLYVTGIATVISIVLLARRNRHLKLLVLWVIVSLAVYNFMSSSLKTYQPFLMAPFVYRYLIPYAMIPCVLTAIVFIGSVSQARNAATTRTWRVAAAVTATAIAAILVVTAVVVFRHYARLGPNLRVERKAAEFIKAGHTIYSDSESNRIIGILLSVTDTPPKTRPIENLTPQSMPKDAYVLLYNPKLNTPGLSRWTVLERQPPPNWSAVWSIPRYATIFHVTESTTASTQARAPQMR